MSIKIKFVIVLMSAFLFGFGACMQATGIKAGVPIAVVSIIWGIGFLGYMIVAFTILQDIKKVLFDDKNEHNT